ncbi:EAL domain-containing protein [Vibrio aquaticus]|uniref:EAL domain-containing protein n=1 Tax=Vibrio aquaticus TaxID=2496559 RepID=A0A3S0PQ09_9VIBR|nr:EAL domain-containing protein [Vibrio aquaticus]RTZ17226.1 EAL domain-containing protein [Vibrio aquaticus]
MKNPPLYRLFQYFSENVYLNGLCNVFVMLLPVSLLSAFTMLIGNLFALVNLHAISEHLSFISTLVWKLFPILLLVYYGLFIASLHKVSKTIIITPSLLIYVILSNEWGLLHVGSVLPANYPLAILTPLLIGFSVRCMTRRRMFVRSELPNVVDQSINLILCTLLLVSFYTMVGHFLGRWFESCSNVSSLVPSIGLHSLFDALWYELLRNVLWSIGINGHIIFSPYKAELYELTQNSFTLYQEMGQSMPILTSNFYDIYAGMGGAGNTLSLVLCILLFTRNKGYRTLALATLVLSVFNINEPVLFGLPVIFNPVLIIPFLITPLVAICMAYFATSFGLVEPITQFVSWMTPAFISGYFATGESVSGSILQLVILLVGILIYMPFFRQMDRVIGANAIFTKVSSDEFFNYEQIGSNRSAGLLPQMTSNLEAQRLISSLQQNGEFVLFYQPQVDVKEGKINSLEVLIRHRANDGTITPPIFLSSFAKLGLTSELDLWVIKKALKEVKVFAGNPSFRVSINVSTETFLVPDFAKTVIEMIEESAMQFNQVELEITEDLLIQDEHTTWQVLTELREKGIKIALDDFGSGYSSIGYLSKYDYDKVKIDRSLVVNLKHRYGREMFRLTSELVKLTGADIVVEGVEDEDELKFISDQGIGLIQGYYFYKPMPFADVCQLLEHKAHH